MDTSGGLSSASYVHGVGAEPLRGQTVGSCLSEAAECWPDGEALVVPWQGVRWSWRELDARSDDVAAGLVGLGLEPGDRVGICAPNQWEWVVIQFATAKAGLVLVNINPAYRLSELEYALKQVGCKALVVAESFKSSDYVAMIRELAPELDHSPPGQLEAARLPLLRTVVVLSERPPAGATAFAQVADSATDRERSRIASLVGELQFDDVINIQFTSGTTGTPKAATLTHHNIVNNAWLVGQRMRLDERDRLCIPVPMYHCFGMVLGTLCCAARGAAMVLPSPGFDPRATLEAIAAERCTAVHGVPTMFIAELDVADFDSFDLSSLRTGIMAGAPCPVELMHRVIDDMGLAEITIAYGMTETGPVSFQTSVDDPVERRVSTVGRVLPFTEVKIIDEAGHIVRRGAAGELATRGYCIMRGYWDDRERTKTTIDEAGWLASGDLAVIDDDGYCQIVGRLKDMIIRGGENIFPREIEDFLYTCPKVDEVEVFGVPDPRYGEEICAWVKLHAGETASEDEIREFCRERIAHFKIPRHVRFVESFPLTVTGKVQKYVMREQMAKEIEAAADPQTTHQESRNE